MSAFDVIYGPLGLVVPAEQWLIDIRLAGAFLLILIGGYGLIFRGWR